MVVVHSRTVRTNDPPVVLLVGRTLCQYINNYYREVYFSTILCLGGPTKQREREKEDLSVPLHDQAFLLDFLQFYKGTCNRRRRHF